MANELVTVRSVKMEDRKWIEPLLKERWGSIEIISRDKKHNALELPGLIALLNNQPVGLVTYNIEDNSCEIISLDSLIEGKGVGTKLIDSIKEEAIKNNCNKVWLVTTNDNHSALKFYQKRGFYIVSIYPNKMAEYREIKPEIPEIGMDNIPLRDEIELALNL